MVKLENKETYSNTQPPPTTHIPPPTPPPPPHPPPPRTPIPHPRLLRQNHCAHKCVSKLAHRKILRKKNIIWVALQQHKVVGDTISKKHQCNKWHDLVRFSQIITCQSLTDGYRYIYIKTMSWILYACVSAHLMISWHVNCFARL